MVDAVREGAYLTHAFKLAGIHRATGAEWLRLGRDRPAEYPDYAQLGLDLEQAEAEYIEEMLGHVNAALELADQVAAGLLPAPRSVVVPLGSGGTAAGLALGLALAGLDATVVAARVGPRLGATRGRVLRLAAATRRFVQRRAGRRLPPPVPVRVVHDVYGGAYGRELPAGTRAALLLQETLAARLDATYSAKGCAAALALAARDPGPTLFWLTFDGRWLDAPP